MKVEDAVRKAGSNEDVLRLKGFFLGSCFTSLTQAAQDVREWTLLYYNPDSRTVVDCFVSEKLITVGEETPALGDMEMLDVGFARISLEDAMQTVNQKFKKTALNTLISLHNKEFNKKRRAVWTIGLVTADISVTAFDIDAQDGKILKEETTRLIKKL